MHIKIYNREFYINIYLFLYYIVILIGNTREKTEIVNSFMSFAREMVAVWMARRDLHVRFFFKYCFADLKIEYLSD